MNNIAIKNKEKSINDINNFIYKLILLFPITTLVQSFFSYINIILFACIFILLIISILQKKIKINFFLLYAVVLFNHIIALYFTNYSKINNKNTLYYFMFWIIFSSFICINKDEFILFLKNNKKYICNVLKISCFIILIAMVMPLSYSSGYFKAFSGSSARLCSVAIYLMTLILLITKTFGLKQYAIYSIFPIYCVVMGDSRTYLVVAIILLVIMLWYYFEQKKYFYLSLIPIIIMGIAIVFSTNILDKILMTTNKSLAKRRNLDTFTMFTSGRNIFWIDMLNAYNKSSLIKKIFGCGFHFVYTVRKFWAHNDFVQLLLTFGITGVMSYLYSIFNLIKNYFSKKNLSFIIIIFTFLIWLFNAFFNMFYVYISAAISFPILLIGISMQKKLFEGRSDKMRFSLLIPVYNVEKYIKDCLDSIDNQTFRDFEVIIIDDGSTDNSGNICDEYSKNKSNVKVIHQNNQGLLLARRVAFKKASGEYCVIIDSDDFIKKNMLEILNKVIEQHNPEMIIFNAIKYYNGLEYKHKEPLFNEDKIFYNNKNELYEKLLSKKMSNTLWTKVVKRKIVDINEDYTKFSKVSMGEDLLQTLPLITNAKSIYYLNEKLYYYRTNTTSITKKFNFECINSLKIVNRELDRYVNIWHYNDKSNIVPARYLSDVYDILNMALHSNDKQQIKSVIDFFKNDKYSKEKYQKASRNGLNVRQQVTSYLLFNNHMILLNLWIKILKLYQIIKFRIIKENSNDG